jgi:hypothetical protein
VPSVLQNYFVNCSLHFLFTSGIKVVKKKTKTLTLHQVGGGGLGSCPSVCDNAALSWGPGGGQGGM